MAHDACSAALAVQDKAKGAGDGAPRDTILRVKRKRDEDPIDAFVVQLGTVPGAKQPRPTARGGQEPGMFRLRETVPKPLNDAARVIEAEWDASRRKIAIKRKRDGHEEDDQAQRKKTWTASSTSPSRMDHFAEMLSDYLKLQPSQAEPSKEAEKYVYDIYYRETVPLHWKLPANKEESKKAVEKHKPPAIGRVARVGPPQVGRASEPAKASYSPVPLPRHTPSATSAPGFEHLSALSTEHAPDWEEDWDEADFIPVFLRPSVDEEGRTTVVPISSTGQRLAEAQLVHEELRAPPSMLGEDEDSNDEDYFGNDYPDRDEWEENSDTSEEPDS